MFFFKRVIDDSSKSYLMLPGGESNPGSRVTGGDTYHYTTENYNIENGQYVFSLKG